MKRMINTCAATVCERVGNNFVMQAVFNPVKMSISKVGKLKIPFSVRPRAALNPAPPAPTTTASYVWSMIG